MEFPKRYIIQCIGHAASNIRLKGEALENLSLLKNFIHRFDNLEFLFAEMKKITALSRIGIKLNEFYVYASSDRVDFSNLSKDFTIHSAELTTPLMFLLNDNATEKLESFFSNIILPDKKNEVEISESEEEIFDTEFLIAKRDEFNELFIPLIKELNEFLDNITPDLIEETQIKHYISLIEEKIKISISANLEIVTRVLNSVVTALKFVLEDTESCTHDFFEKIRSALIVVVVVLRGKDIDLELYLEEVTELDMIMSKK